MSHEKEASDSTKLPKSHTKRSRLTYLVWLVPVAALAFAGWLVYDTILSRGPTIYIWFRDANGIEPGKTQVKYLGAQIGQVNALKIGDRNDQVRVEVELEGSAGRLARDGTQFWLVKPEIGAGGIRGLGTVVSGDYIAAKPGEGSRTNCFTALKAAPASQHVQAGVTVSILAARRGSLRKGSAVYYRDIRVGEVVDCALTPDAQAVAISLKIQQHYVPLVRDNSKFWNVSGIELEAGLLGFDLRLNPLKAVFAGGIAFATPNPPGNPVENGAVFPLHDKADDEWLQWAPAISLATSEQKGEADDE